MKRAPPRPVPGSTNQATCEGSKGVSVQIDDVNASLPLSTVGLGLTPSEALELRDTLDILLESPVGRHEHVSPKDSTETETIVWLAEP